MAGLLIRLCGGPPWGFRLHGGRGQNIPLTVAKVRRKSKSYGHLVEGDELSRIGGRSVDGLSHDEAMTLVDSHQDKLELEIVRRRDPTQCTESTTAAAGTSSISSPAVIPATPDAAGASGKLTCSSAEDTSFTGLPQALQSSHSSVDTPPPKVQSPGLLAQQQQQQQQQQTAQVGQVSGQAFGTLSDLTSQDQGLTKSADRATHLIDEHRSHSNEMKSSTSEARSSERTVSSSTTVNISGAKFDLGSDFTAPTSIGAGVKSVPGSTLVTSSNPFVGVERILESETKSSKEQIPGGELNRLETRETKITEDGGYMKSHTLSEHKVSSTSSTSPLSVSVKAGTGGSLYDDDILLISPTGRPIKERYYRPLPEDQLKEIDDIMAPILNKKKVFTSSAFYEDANSTYPTVEEQVGMARKIAESLSSDSNAQSKGANMFFRRVKRSHKWVHQAPGISESEYTESEDCSTMPDPDKFPGVKISKDPPKLKLLMAPSASKWDQSNTLQDVTVSPEVCLDIVKGLNSPSGKGSQMFAKRKKKSEDWVVDVDKLKAQLGDRWPEKDKIEDDVSAVAPPPPPPPVPPARPTIQAPRIKEASSPADRYLEQISQQTSASRLRLVKSPWEAAMESPIGAVDSAFQTITAPGSVSWGNQLIQTQLAPISVPSGPEVIGAPFDPLKTRSPRGWDQRPSAATQNVCVTVNKKKPPPPPPRPDKIRPPRYQPTAAPGAAPSPVVVACGGPQGDLRFEIETGPPAQFFSSFEEFAQAPRPVENPPQLLGGGGASGRPPCLSSASRAFSPFDCQNFNAAPRGFGFGAPKGHSNFRSVHL